MAIPHFAIPFKIDGPRGALVNEQDSFEEIHACVETIIRYTIGDRPERPEFGIPDQTFVSPSPDTNLIKGAVGQWEDRVDTEIGNAILDNLNPLIQNIKVEVISE